MIEPFGVVDFADIAAVVDCFTDSATAPPLVWCDITGGVNSYYVPDQAVDFTDISAVIDAFTGGSYPLEGSEMCQP